MAKKYLFNPFTGNFDLVDITASGGGSYNVDKVTLTGTEITNKSLTLGGAPSVAADTRLIVIEGIEQEYGADFTVSGSTLSWNGLGLDGLLEIGDKLIIVYN